MQPFETPLSHRAQAAIPEITAWLEHQAATTLRWQGATGTQPDPDSWLNETHLAAVVALLRRQSARPTLDDTAYLFAQSAERAWPWGTWTIPVYDYSDEPGAAPVNWTRTITEKTTGHTVQISHYMLLGALVRIVQQHATITTGDNPPMNHAELRLILNVMGAPDRDGLTVALGELPQRLCMVIVQLAVFGEYRYRDDV